MRRNAFFLIIDALRYDAVSDSSFLEIVMPTLCSMRNSGAMKRLITNGQVTQFVMPSIFTQTYPLDHGGYNSGLRERPASFSEIFERSGYATRMFESHDIDGPHGMAERGFQLAEIFYDKRLLLEGFLKKRLLYEIKLWRDGEYTTNEIISLVHEQYGAVLDYLEHGQKRTTEKEWFRSTMGPLSQHDRSRLKAERMFLNETPLELIEKIERVPPYFYFNYLGRQKLGLGLKIRSKLFGLAKRYQAIISQFLHTELKILGNRPRIPPLAGNVLRRAATVATSLQQPWFIYAHVMDPHDHELISRPFHLLCRLRFAPRVIRARRQQRRTRIHINRSFTYDLALAYVDSELSRLIRRLKEAEVADNTLFVFTGDHGEGWDNARDRKLKTDFGFRTYYEHISVPLIITPVSRPPSTKGIHDSMSVGASILDELALDSHESFKGIPIFAPGRSMIVTENCGRGNADIKRRDIYFTVTSVTHKAMFQLHGTSLQAKRLYSLEHDPRELNNIIKDPANQNVIADMESYLLKERGVLLTQRDLTRVEDPSQ